MKLKNTTIENFFECIGNKKIVCFGAGKLFEGMFDTMPEFLLKKIACVIDSNKQNDVLKISNYTVPLKNIENINEINFEETILLITAMNCYSIYIVLDKLFRNYDIDCYVYTIMSMKPGNSILKVLTSNEKIPKTIHYCWFGKNKMPEKNIKCINTWKKVCPDYKIIRWDESNYDVTKNKYMYDAYKCKKWGFVPDYARLDLIYQYGGIYLDTDVELIRKPDELLKYDGFMGFQRNFWVNFGLGFGATKGNELIKALRNAYEEINFINKDDSMNLIPSPYYQTYLLRQYKLVCNNDTQFIDKNAILSSDYFDPQSFRGGQIRCTHNTIGIHHYDESWSEERIKNQIGYSEINRMLNLFKLL